MKTCHCRDLSIVVCIKPMCNISLVWIISYLYFFMFSSWIWYTYDFLCVSKFDPISTLRFQGVACSHCLPVPAISSHGCSVSATIYHRILPLHDSTEYFSRVMMSEFGPYWSMWTEYLVIHSHISIFLLKSGSGFMQSHKHVL